MTHDVGLSERDVVEAYRVFLGREPESAEAIAGHLAAHADAPSLWAAMLGSPEFAASRIHSEVQATFRGLLFDPVLPIQHDAPPATMVRMMARIREEWTRLGASEPHWSVLTEERFRAGVLDEAALAAFQESGAREIELMDLFEARTGVAGPRGTCVEIGCGVGRVTWHLAQRFERVVAVDVSPGNLALCRAYMAKVGLDTVDPVLVQGLEDFEALPEADYVFSVIALQHNPPPIQKAMLRTLFSRLRPGGAVLFQLQGAMAGYGFDAESYLAQPPPEMEMHCLPRAVVLAEMAAHGITAVDVVPDHRTGIPGSCTFYGVKRA